MVSDHFGEILQKWQKLIEKIHTQHFAHLDFARKNENISFGRSFPCCELISSGFWCVSNKVVQNY
jgi:hypothetical protein